MKSTTKETETVDPLLSQYDEEEQAILTAAPVSTEYAQRSDYAHKEKPKETFTEEEIIELEQELIDTYITSKEKPIKIFLTMYRKYVKDIMKAL